MADSSDSEAPEEITAAEAIKQDEDIRKVQRENVKRITHENKERRRQWAQRKTPSKSKKENISEVDETKEQQEEPSIPGMLPSNIVSVIAAREKKTFSSDSEEEVVKQKTTRVKKQKTLGPETVVLNNIPHAQCLQTSLDFLKKRKMQVARSTAVLKNADQALRLLSSKGNLLNKS